MRNNLVRFAALAATVSFCLLSADLVTAPGKWSPVRLAMAVEEGGQGHGLANGAGGLGSAARIVPQVAPEPDRIVDRANGNTAEGDDTAPADIATPTSDEEDIGANREAATSAMISLPVSTDGELERGSLGVPSFAYKARQPEYMGNGAFSEFVEIRVPVFRGFEPKLALQYSSNGGVSAGGLSAGWIGVGWSLSGMPDIVRTAPINGTPRFGETDVFQIDGQDMIACGKGLVSLSCATGGTHATKVESYQRITFTSNTWTVWEKDGSRSIFKPLSTWGVSVPSYDKAPKLIQDEYRWLLASRIDTKGNEVVYTYTCLTLPVCYPDTITYNGAEIKFVSIAHPAYQTKATGRGLAVLDRQLARIEIKMAGSQVRAYSLTQETSASTGLARLKTVTEYGTGWSVTDGKISGQALPAIQFTYSDAKLSYKKMVNRAGFAGDPNS